MHGVAKNVSLLAVRALECLGNGTVSQARARPVCAEGLGVLERSRAWHTDLSLAEQLYPSVSTGRACGAATGQLDRGGVRARSS